MSKRTLKLYVVFYDLKAQRLLYVISPAQRPLPANTQHSEQTDIHATGGIRTHNPSKRAPQTHALHSAANGIGDGHTKHVNTPCRQEVELLNVKPGGKGKDKAVPMDAMEAFRGNGGIAPYTLNIGVM
jgi:hypothetical protein